MGVLTFVRHGQASFGADNYDKLSEVGEEQSRVLGEYFAEQSIEFSHVFVGPLARQQRTAQLVGEVMAAANRPWPEPISLEGLAELPVEELSRKHSPLLMQEDPELAQLMMQFQEATDGIEKEMLFRQAFSKVMRSWKDGQFDDGEIETWKDFSERVEETLDTIVSHTGQGNHAVAFSSGGPNALAVRYALDGCADAAMELAWAVRNASFSEFTFSDGQLHLQSVNSIPHFREARLITHR